MGYTVIDDEGAQGSGLTLSEAFARMMAFARCEYSFGRLNGDIHLTITRADDAPGRHETEPPPALRSKLLDNDKARAEIMRRFLNRSINGYRSMTDEDWQREERERCGQEGFRPARRVDVE